MNIVLLDSLANLLNNVDYLLIGRYLGPEALGIYTLGFRIPDLILTQFARIVSNVIFPVYVKMKDQAEMLNRGFLKSLQYVSLVTVPLGVGIAIIAEPMVRVLFTDKWIEVVPVIRAIAIYALLLSLFRNAGSFYKAQGRPEILTYLTLLRLGLLMPALFYVVVRLKSIVAVGWVQAIVALASGVISLIVASKMFKIEIREIMVQFVPALISGLAMAVVCFAVLRLTSHLSVWLQMGIAIPASALSYGLALQQIEPQQFLIIRQMLLKGITGK